MHCESENFPVGGENLIAVVFDEVIIIRGVQIIMGNLQICGICNVLPIHILKKMLVQEIFMHVTPEDEVDDLEADNDDLVHEDISYSCRNWKKIKQGVIFGWEVESIVDESIVDKTSSEYLEKQYLLVRTVDPNGYAGKALKIKPGDKIYGMMVGTVKSTRVSNDDILKHIGNCILNSAQDKVNKNAAKRNNTTAKRKKRKSKADRLRANDLLLFKNWALCVQPLTTEDRQLFLKDNLGQAAIEEEMKLKSMLQHVVGTGYTQFRLVGLSSSGFDYLIFDCISKTLTENDLFGVIQEILIRTNNFGINVGMVISDGFSANRSLWIKYFTYSNPFDVNDNAGMKTYMKHPVTQRPVFYVPDPSHVIKKLCNSLANSNHLIMKKDPLTPTINPTLALTLNKLYELWQSFEGQNGMRIFQFNRSDFIKTNCEKMRVGPCIKIWGPRMVAMLNEADSRQELYESKCPNYSIYSPWINIKLLTGPIREMCNHISSVYSILNRRRMPGLSAKPDGIFKEELAVFKETENWLYIICFFKFKFFI